MNFVGFQRGSSRTRASRNAIRCGLKQCALYSTSSHTPTCPMFPIFLAPSKGWPHSFSALHRERKRQFWSTRNLHVPRMAQGSDPGHQRCHDLIDIQILTDRTPSAGRISLVTPTFLLTGPSTPHYPQKLNIHVWPLYYTVYLWIYVCNVNAVTIQLKSNFMSVIQYNTIHDIQTHTHFKHSVYNVFHQLRFSN